MNMDTHSRVIMLLLLLIASGSIFSEGLKLIELAVPKHANLGDAARLGCSFDLDSAGLYSVKWYKDENEFFRFMPDNTPQTQVFPLAGITLDESESGMNSVTLVNLEYSSSGSYRCEVSTEAPSFETVVDTRNMTVYAYPESDPEIHGLQSSYSEGDYVAANCTASPSYPPPHLDWYINGIKADSWLVEISEAVPIEDNRYIRSLGLRFLVEKHHFQGASSVLELRCQAMVDILPPREKTVRLHLADNVTKQKLAQQRHRNGAYGSRHTGQWRYSVLLAIAILCLSET